MRRYHSRAVGTVSHNWHLQNFLRMHNHKHLTKNCPLHALFNSSKVIRVTNQMLLFAFFPLTDIVRVTNRTAIVKSAAIIAQVKLITVKCKLNSKLLETRILIDFNLKARMKRIGIEKKQIESDLIRFPLNCIYWLRSARQHNQWRRRQSHTHNKINLLFECARDEKDGMRRLNFHSIGFIFFFYCRHFALYAFLFIVLNVLRLACSTYKYDETNLARRSFNDWQASEPSHRQRES